MIFMMTLISGEAELRGNQGQKHPQQKCRRVQVPILPNTISPHLQDCLAQIDKEKRCDNINMNDDGGI
jgi:hypothetical protein